MRRPLIGVVAFLLGGTTAAALSLGNAPPGPGCAGCTRRRACAGTGGGIRSERSAGVGRRPDPAPGRQILRVPGHLHYGDYRWDDDGVPAGPTWVRVDLKAQILSVFRGGHEIGTAVILYGADGLPTPTGKFPVLAKLKDHRSLTMTRRCPTRCG